MCRRFYPGFVHDGSEILEIVSISERGTKQLKLRCRCGAVFEKTSVCIAKSKTCRCKACAKAAAVENRIRKKELSGTPKYQERLYYVWLAMRNRCVNPQTPSYRNYGARGISVYGPWLEDYRAFSEYVLSNLGDRPSKSHSLDRIDNDGNYEPGNLRWATRSEQVRNSRPRMRKKNPIYLDRDWVEILKPYAGQSKSSVCVDLEMSISKLNRVLQYHGLDLNRPNLKG